MPSTPPEVRNEAIPTRFEIYMDDDPETLAAKVSCLMPNPAHKDKTVVSADTWPELSLQIQHALEMVIEGVYSDDA